MLSLEVTGLVVEEVWRFWIVTWLQDRSVTWLLGEVSSSWVSTLPILGGHEPGEGGSITCLICHRTTWSCVTWLGGWGTLILSHQPAKFGIHKPSESKDITFFICHMTTKCHVLQRYFVDGVQSSPKSPHC